MNKPKKNIFTTVAAALSVYLAIKAYYAKLHKVKFNIITAMTRIIVS